MLRGVYSRKVQSEDRIGWNECSKTKPLYRLASGHLHVSIADGIKYIVSFISYRHSYN